MPIPMFKTSNNPSALTWILFTITSSCKELWQIIDTKESPFKWNGWEGWLLTAIQHYCFKYNIISNPKFSVFKKPKSMSSIVEKVNNLIEEEVNNTKLYQLLNKIFGSRDYTDSVCFLFLGHFLVCAYDYHGINVGFVSRKFLTMCNFSRNQYRKLYINTLVGGNSS